MKKLLVTMFLLGVSRIIIAQENKDTVVPKYWDMGGTLAVNVSQSTFSNWAAGGENYYGGTGFVNLLANYKKEKVSWDNKLDLGFGIIKQGERPVFKTEDKIDLSSKYGRRATEHWNYTVLFGFKSQFYQGKKSINDTTKISNFMAPAYLMFSIGMDYKPIKGFSLFLSPISLKTTYVLDKQLSARGAFGVKPDSKNPKSLYEIGGYLKSEYKTNIIENIEYKGKLELFSNYLEKPQNITINWETTLNFKINKFFSANFYLTMIYDDKVKTKIPQDDGTVRESPKIQIKQIFGVGFTYNCNFDKKD